MKHTVLCSRKFPVAKKVFGKQGGGGVECQVFPSKIICLTVSKNSAVESFAVALISGIEKNLDNSGGGIKIFRRKTFVPY